MKRFRAKASRGLGFETLESRALMTAEGQALAVDQTLDVSDLFGAISGTIAWGDGTATADSAESASAWTDPIPIGLFARYIRVL